MGSRTFLAPFLAPFSPGGVHGDESLVSVHQLGEDLSGFLALGEAIPISNRDIEISGQAWPFGAEAIAELEFGFAVERGHEISLRRR